MENDLTNFIAALKAYLAAPSLAGLLGLLAPLARLIADIKAAWPQAPAVMRALDGLDESGLCAELVAASAAAKIDWTNVLQVLVALARVLLPVVLQ